MQGVYLLRIAVVTPLAIPFWPLCRWSCYCAAGGGLSLYRLGHGATRATTLAGRLLRHATRSADRAPHAVRGELVKALQAADQRVTLPTAKRVRWHIDYLLDEAAADLRQIYALRTASPIEVPLARWLMAEPVTAVVAPGWAPVMIVAPPTCCRSMPQPLGGKRCLQFCNSNIGQSILSMFSGFRVYKISAQQGLIVVIVEGL
ncbi:MAG: DUF123 domain-containing protein [Caldilineaceae bacterium]